MKKKPILIIITGIFITVITSCNKDWLDKKENISVVVPTSLVDMRLLLNNDVPLGLDNRGVLEVATGDYYIDNNDYQALATYLEKQLYIWGDDPFVGLTYLPEWDYSYQEVLNANVILEGLSKITPNASTQVEYNDIKGGALFERSRAFYNVAQIFAKTYDSTTATKDLGIPLRLASDINIKSVRSTVEQTYDQIVTDLQQAATLVKVVPTNPQNASRPGVYGELARCYLSMGKYDKALQYATLSLNDYSTLMDYNTLDPTIDPPFQLFNSEVIFHSEIYTPFPSFSQPIGKIDSNLYKSYDANDLRKTLFFISNGDGTFSFQGYYSGTSLLFGGLAVDEIYLIKAECEARIGSVSDALKDLNTLLITRYKTGTFQPISAPDANTALSIILTERRKELLMRGLRWSDLRRLNNDPRFAVTLARTVNGQVYTLKPGDPRYTFLIPDYVIQASGLQQNVR